METGIGGKVPERIATSANSGAKKVSNAFTGAAIFSQQLSAQGGVDFPGLSLAQQECSTFACPPVRDAIAQ